MILIQMRRSSISMRSARKSGRALRLPLRERGL
jgi:hypothetical protein